MPVKLQEDHVLCRSRMLGGHDWHVGRKLGKKANLGTLLSLHCARCGMWRHDTIGTYGQLVTRNYDQPDGYHMDADDQPSGDDLRLAVLKIVDKGIRQGTLLDLIALEDEDEKAQRAHTPKQRAGRKAPTKTATNGRGRGRHLASVG